MEFSKKQTLAILFVSIILGGFGLGYGIYMTITSGEKDGITINPTFDEDDVFVSTSGLDLPNQGSQTEPYRTITYALSHAASLGADRIIVELGFYNESIILEDGISIMGGYSKNFRFYSLKYYRSTIQAMGSSRWTIFGSEIGFPTILEGFVIKGPWVTSNSMNSYGIYLEDCNSSLIIRECEIWGGIAGDGLSGVGGEDGSAVVNGSNGEEGSTPSSVTEVLGGAGGQKLFNVTYISGGDGGSTGITASEQDSRTADDGHDATYLGGGTGGYAGYDGAIEFVNPNFVVYVTLEIDGMNGQDGANGEDGVGGIGGQQNTSSIISGEWKGDDGGNGSTGLPGNGGGGGGAGGGLDVYTYGFYADLGMHIFGGTGGGGGSGGTPSWFGDGGKAGGGVFCIYIINTPVISSLPLIYNNSIYLSQAGDGGDGGRGGIGKEGGKGGFGGLENQVIELGGIGGNGGDGGAGGHGGGGGGGAGGCSIGIFVYGLIGTSVPYYSSNNINTFTGSAGFGGQGGQSWGNNGSDGEDGLLNATLYL